MTKEEINEIVEEMGGRHFTKRTLAFKVKDNYAIIQNALNKKAMSVKGERERHLYSPQKIVHIVNATMKKYKVTELIATEIVKKEIKLQNVAK
jgi:hypothetical protein